MSLHDPPLTGESLTTVRTRYCVIGYLTGGRIGQARGSSITGLRKIGVDIVYVVTGFY